MPTSTNSDLRSTAWETRASKSGFHPTLRNLLVGRDAEVTALAALIAKRSLLTVVGLAGVGKTRLVRSVAAMSGREVFFCDLARAASSTDVESALLHALAAVRLGEADGLDGVLGSLAKRDALVVLDGIDHLDRGVVDAIVTMLLDACSDIRIVMTARQREHLTGEVVFPLEPLSLEADDTGLSPAAELFLRLVEDRTGRDLSAGGGAPLPADVSRLLRVLDGIPLALEAAASSLSVLKPSELFERRALLLDAPLTSAEWQGGTLRSAFEALWQRLPTAEQTACIALTVFPDAFDLDAAAAVLGKEAFAIVAQLRRRSLIQVEEVGSVSRFRLLEGIKLLVIEAHSRADVFADARGSHAAYFGKRGVELILRGEEYDRGEALAAIAREEQDHLAVIERGLASALDVDAASGAMAALSWFWLSRGTFASRLHVVTRFEALARRGFESSLGMALFLLGSAWMHRQLGDLGRAAELADEALRRSQILGHSHFEARCHLERARIAHLRGDRSKAFDAVSRAETIAEVIGSDGLRAMVMLSWRLAARRLNDDALAKVRELARSAGDPLVIFRVELALGTHCFSAGRPEVALEHTAFVENAAEGLVQRSWRALAALVSGNALAELGRRSEARAKLEAAAEWGRQASHRRSQAEARGNLALLDLEEGRVSEAIDGLSVALKLFAPGDKTRVLFEAALAGAEAMKENHALKPVGELATEGVGPARVAARVHRSIRDRLERKSLVVARDLSWFRAPSSEVVSLATRPLLRELLGALLAEREASSSAVSRDHLIEILWPGERSSIRSMRNRLSVAISTLRCFGLPLVRTGRGIGLDPKIGLIVVDAEEVAA